MKIGISGAGGQLGRSVLRALNRRAGKHVIVAITRQPDQLDEQVEARHGDYDKPETLAAAYAGLDRLLIIPSPDFRPGVRSAQGRLAVDAAVAEGVDHIFLLSATGTRMRPEPAVGAAYWISERQLLSSTAKAWTILRANYFAETFAEQASMAAQIGHVPGIAENRVAFVSREDVAEACAAALATDGHEGAIYNLSGPDRVSGAERAALIAKHIGQPVAFTTMTMSALRDAMAGAQLPSFIIDAVVSMQVAQADGAYDVVTGDVEKLTGHSPQSLPEVFRSVNLQHARSGQDA